MADLVCANDTKRSFTPKIMYSTVESMGRYLDIIECRREFDDVKEVPPMAIIYVHSLMERAWTWKRIVPWRVGYVPLRHYMDYLNVYFEKNASVRPDVCAEAERCLKMEKKYVDSRGRGGPLSKKDADLSRMIIKLAENMRDSGSLSITAAAGLTCIAEEARLMSKLESDTKLFKFSNKVRWSASKIMMYKAHESRSVAAGMLGMAKEARIARKLLSAVAKKDCESYARLEVCKVVRKCSLDLMIKFKRIFAIEASASSATYKTEGKPADDNFAGNKNSMDINQNKKKIKSLPEIEDSEGMDMSSPPRP